MPLIHCIYASGAAPGCTDAEIQDLLTRSREQNALAGVTGILVSAEGSFFQVLEGEAAVVDALYARIASDRRHTRVTLIIREPIARRAFANWSMGYLSMTSAGLASLLRGKASVRSRLASAQPALAGHAWLSQVDEGRAKKLLAAFAGGRWRSRPARAHLRPRQSRAA